MAGPWEHTTALSISDNLVSCLAFEKGRSRSTALNKLCQRAAAYQLACRVQWRLRRISAERNVADGPSRMWGPDFHKFDKREKGARRERPKPAEDVHYDIDSFELGWSPASSSSSPSSTASERQASDRKTYFLEVFSGAVRLSAAMAAAGLNILPDIEIAKGKHFDVASPACQKTLLQWLREGRI